MKKKILVVFAVFVFTAMSFAGKWIVEGNLPADLASRVQAAGGVLLGTVDAIGAALVEFDNEADARAFEGIGLNVMPDVNVNFIPNPQSFAHTAGIGDNEPFCGFQWHLPAIGADLAWDAGITGAGARVAVLDTGIWYLHPDLMGNIDYAASASFVPYEPDYIDGDGHGTHVAGIIAAADNDWGSIGVAPDATLIAVKVLDNTGAGSFYWITQGIYHAVMQDADVINMSLRGYLLKSGVPGDYTAADANALKNLVKKAVTWASNQGSLVVYAAGNEAVNLNKLQNIVMIPGELGNGLCISATGPIGLQNFDNPASYTNYGKGAVDLAGPGGDAQLWPQPNWHLDMVFSTTVGGWMWAAGTSMATPNVCGVAALAISKYGKMSVPVLKNHLTKTADDLGKPGNDDFYGMGRVNAYRAVTE